MIAAFKLDPVAQATEKLSQKPPLGEKRPKLRLVWENPRLSAGSHKEKPEAKPGASYGRVLYNYYRYYDPNIGRYITHDPLGVLPGLTPMPNLPKEISDYYQSFSTQQIVAFGLNHLFAYVENNPLRFTDPFGLSPGMGGGTTSCAHYDMRCAQSGGTSAYYCSIAPLACSYTPPFDWTRCVRQCLQDFDKACGRECDGSPNTQCTVEAHAHCWLKCRGL